MESMGALKATLIDDWHWQCNSWWYRGNCTETHLRLKGGAAQLSPRFHACSWQPMLLSCPVVLSNKECMAHMKYTVHATVEYVVHVVALSQLKILIFDMHSKAMRNRCAEHFVWLHICVHNPGWLLGYLPLQFWEDFVSGMNPINNSRNCTLQQSSVNCRDWCVHRQCHCKMCQ